MTFKMKYPIEKGYLAPKTSRRPGVPINKVGFLTAHDSGNPGSTAAGNIKFYQNTVNDDSASAHTFIDDTRIIECIPLLTGRPEKAWHVRYLITIDNKMYGDDANDIAGGVEFCWGGKINFEEAYKRFVWYLAYACYVFKLDPAKKIPGHEMLDPGRKIDPSNGLKFGKKTYAQLIKDVVKEFNDCTGLEVALPVKKEISKDFVLIKKGDTLWGIANDYKEGITVNDLIKLNPHIEPQELKIGDKVYLKKAAPKVESKPKLKYDLPHKELRLGATGPDVLLIQKALVMVYFYPEKDAKDNGCDGSFGPKTKNALMRFQMVNGIVADGVYGPKTESVLEKMLNK